MVKTGSPSYAAAVDFVGVTRRERFPLHGRRDQERDDHAVRVHPELVRTRPVPACRTAVAGRTRRRCKRSVGTKEETTTRQVSEVTTRGGSRCARHRVLLPIDRCGVGARGHESDGCVDRRVGRVRAAVPPRRTRPSCCRAAGGVIRSARTAAGLRRFDCEQWIAGPALGVEDPRAYERPVAGRTVAGSQRCSRRTTHGGGPR